MTCGCFAYGIMVRRNKLAVVAERYLLLREQGRDKNKADHSSFMRQHPRLRKSKVTVQREKWSVYCIVPGGAL
jgi:hypothetical protein